MKLSKLFESYDYGSQFMAKRAEIDRTTTRIEELEAELIEALRPAYARDFESDKDYEGGARYIRKGLAKLRSRLAKLKEELEEIRQKWESLGPSVGEEF